MTPTPTEQEVDGEPREEALVSAGHDPDGVGARHEAGPLGLGARGGQQGVGAALGEKSEAGRGAQHEWRAGYRLSWDKLERRRQQLPQRCCRLTGRGRDRGRQRHTADGAAGDRTQKTPVPVSL